MKFFAKRLLHTIAGTLLLGLLTDSSAASTEGNDGNEMGEETRANRNTTSPAAQTCPMILKMAKSWHPTFDRYKIDDYMVHGFSAQRADEAPFLVRNSKGIYLKPSLDVSLSANVPAKCFLLAQELTDDEPARIWLATNRYCNKKDRLKTKVRKIPGDCFEGNEQRWQLTLGDVKDEILLMQGGPKKKYKDFKVKKFDMKLYFCVQVGPAGKETDPVVAKRPIHMVYYYQDPKISKVKRQFQNWKPIAEDGWSTTFTEMADRGSDDRHSDTPAYGSMMRYFVQRESAADEHVEQWIKDGAEEDINRAVCLRLFPAVSAVAIVFGLAATSL